MKKKSFGTILQKSPMILSTSWYITHSFLSQHLFWSTGKKSDFCLWFWILWVTFWGQETTLLLNDSFFFTWMGMCQIPDFILEKVKQGSLVIFFFFCWPLSHDFLIKCLKAFGEATPIYPKHPRSLSLTFPKQITKDTQILRTCRHVDCRYMHYVHVPFSVLKCDIEVQKNRKKEGRDWFRVLWRGNVWKFGASWYFLNALWKPTEIPAKF